MDIFNYLIKKIVIISSCLLFTACSNTVESESIDVIDNVENTENNNNFIANDVEPTEIFIVTDIHYLSNNINDGGEAFQTMVENSDGRQVNYIEELTDALTYEIIEKKPGILVVSGDLTHNGEKQSHLDIAEKFKKIEESGTEVYIVPGNHDINNPFAREFKGSEQVRTDTVTPDEFVEIYKTFGFSESISRDNNSLSYLAAPSENLWLLMLDTNIYDQNTYSPATNGVLSKDTLEWIKECSEKAKENNAEIVVAMHHNLYKHSDLLYNGYVLDNAEEVFEVFKDSIIKITLSGHIHIQDIMADENNMVYDIVTSGFTIYPIQYGILNFSDAGYKYSTNSVNVEKWASDNSIDNDDLLNLSEYSKNYFFDLSADRTFTGLLYSNDFGEEIAREMANTMGLLNINYFGGTTNDIREEVLASDGYALWVDSIDSFLKTYVIDMAKERENMNYLEISK